MDRPLGLSDPCAPSTRPSAQSGHADGPPRPQDAADVDADVMRRRPARHLAAYDAGRRPAGGTSCGRPLGRVRRRTQALGRDVLRSGHLGRVRRRTQGPAESGRPAERPRPPRTPQDASARPGRDVLRSGHVRTPSTRAVGRMRRPRGRDVLTQGPGRPRHVRQPSAAATSCGAAPPAACARMTQPTEVHLSQPHAGPATHRRQPPPHRHRVHEDAPDGHDDRPRPHRRRHEGERRHQRDVRPPQGPLRRHERGHGGRHRDHREQHQHRPGQRRRPVRSSAVAATTSTSTRYGSSARRTPARASGPTSSATVPATACSRSTASRRDERAARAAGAGSGPRPGPRPCGQRARTSAQPGTAVGLPGGRRRRPGDLVDAGHDRLVQHPERRRAPTGRTRS